jgi:uncharacterized protein (DUF58 family)
VPTANSYGALLDALRGVSWPARRVVRGSTMGTHRSRLRGVSPEFTEYRPYRPGDDPRTIDWKLLARTDRAYRRITADRATLTTMVLVDASASMAYPAGARSKWEHACRLAVGLVAVAHAAGDPVGLVVPTAGGTQHLAPRTRRGVVAEAARMLETIAPAGTAPLAPAMALLKRGARIALVTDFLGDASALLREAQERIVGGGAVDAVHVVAREELDPPEASVMATDPEAPELRRALVEATRAGYRESFAAWRAALARAWRDAGAGYAEVVTDEPAEHAVRRIARDVPA